MRLSIRQADKATMAEFRTASEARGGRAGVLWQIAELATQQAAVACALSSTAGASSSASTSNIVDILSLTKIGTDFWESIIHEASEKSEKRRILELVSS
jgi:hypothetical protein